MSNNNNNEINFLLKNWDEKEHNFIVINESIIVPGTMNIIIQKVVEKNKKIYFKITGALETEYYEKEIRSLESSRYYVSDVDVISEEFGSLDDSVVYRFEAQYFTPKYQTEKYDTIDNRN